MSQALTANRLSDGRVVFLTTSGRWSPELCEARVAEDADAQASLSALGEAAEAACEVVGPYLIDVRHEDDGLVAVEIREAIRANGPTVQAGQF